MGFARTCSVALVGVEGVVVEIQADLEPGVATFTLVGLPDKSLTESRDRVRAAVVNAGADWPQKKLTVGLSPAAVPKSGSGFDLGVACAVLGAAERIDPRNIADLVMLGELGLDGRVRPVRGVLPAVLAAADAGHRQVVVAEEAVPEASLVPDVSVLGVRSLRQLIALLNDETAPEEEPADGLVPEARGPGRGSSALSLPGHEWAGPGMVRGPERSLDMADVAGQSTARRALEVAAAGRHHIFFKGPPGAGKTMLAERLPGLLPPLTSQQSLEVTAVHSVAGVLPPGQPLVTRSPYCAPHHSATMASLVGGGSGLPRPGAVSMAHHGVLFLDEAAECSGRVLDAMRQPLESGHVVVARASGVMRMPARFLLVLAANPCPCGRHGMKGGGCECRPASIRRYRARLSGPLMDRVDLRVHVKPLSRSELAGLHGSSDSTAAVAERVLAARERAAARYAGTPWSANSDVPGHELRTRWPAEPGALGRAEEDMEHGLLTARGMDRVLRVAWTVADLAGHDRPTAQDVDWALELRTGIRRGTPVSAATASASRWQP
ncbi:Mg chelatase-like protein [Streptomyces abyssalis]|uniref:Mg chelatase-like protein n=1 Tax=Streptomyces abyssalis TaxID=933944 RepID=A0A1E7JHG2_9ACTN|nr:YifB family Mg chelatase-like AAA ATPase [Streptomyces abyssalis]OEU85890.1 Mg chelatase-like protein [Streptomyces abyssalis]OEU92644.1 Mg chelatase-like protein [Streptomyces abyssalis]OEV29198.1 Mg chelatase-like protein [Streptomyces nanshensis]